MRLHRRFLKANILYGPFKTTKNYLYKLIYLLYVIIMNTTIAVSKETRDILQDFGKKSESYDEVIRRMYNTIKLQEALREFVDENEYSTLEEAKEWTNMKIKMMNQ